MLNLLLFATAYNGKRQCVERELQRDGRRVYISYGACHERVRGACCPRLDFLPALKASLTGDSGRCRARPPTESASGIRNFRTDVG